MELSPLTFGERIRVCRRRVGLSQQALAKLLGVHESTICRWERDQHTLEMTLKNFMKIAEATKTFDDFYFLLKTHLHKNFDSLKILNLFETAFDQAKKEIILQEEELGGES